MIDMKRKAPRFDISFELSANQEEGKGINISQKGLGFLTTHELMPAESIPFNTEIKGYIFSQKSYRISGSGRLLYSIRYKENTEFFYNGFEFITLDEGSNEKLMDLLEDIRKFNKSLESGIEHKTLADFNYYPSDDVFQKSNIFYESMSKIVDQKYKMFSFYLDSASKSTSDFVQMKSGDTKQMIMMGSNNYLGLTVHPEVIAAAKKALDTYGVGNGSGAMVGGTLKIHKELEEALADFTGKESVMLFNSGYAANVGIISGTLRPGDAVVNDQLNHASVFDGCKLSGAKDFVYSHNNMDSLERILKRAQLKFNGTLIVVNGIYSTNGETAPLDEIVKIAVKYNCRVMVDEAHGLGVVGKKGIGACELFDVHDKVDIIMGTLSKSLAGVGGFAASSKELIDYLKYYSRSYLFSTSIPPATAASVLKALELLRDNPEIREQLSSNITFFRESLQKLNLNIGNTRGAIIPIYIPDMKNLLGVSKKLFEKGIYHNVMSYPAVPMGGSLLRFGIMATHTRAELQQAVDAIRVCMDEEGLLDQTESSRDE